MAKIKKPQKVKLIAGLIAQRDYLEPAVRKLKEKFGPLDFQSDVLEFKHTDYYFKEMGKPLYRQFISFRRLISPQALYKMKLYTNKLELKLSKDGGRRVNIDPGYVALSKLVLASAKDFYHRIYLSGGIYAEVTLVYQNADFKPLEWTFPDYSCDAYKEIFKKIRGIYAQQIAQESNIS